MPRMVRKNSYSLYLMYIFKRVLYNHSVGLILTETPSSYSRLIIMEFHLLKKASDNVV